MDGRGENSMSQFPDKKEPVCFNPECRYNSHYIYLGAHEYKIPHPNKPLHIKYIERYLCAGLNEKEELKQFVLCEDCAKDDEIIKRIVGEML